MSQQSSYGAIPSEDPDNTVDIQAQEEDTSSTRYKIGEILESKKAHIIILTLTAIDVALVILQIAASLLHLDDTKEAQWFLELLAHISLAIVSFFVLEIVLKIYAFGFGYFWTGNPHGILHLLDALIIIISFLLEIFLKGAEQELGALLIIFRLWRIVKLTGTVAIETAEHNHATVAALEQRIKVLENELKESQAEVQRLLANTADQV
ncbi:hypothetical protein BGZ97_013133 [Linnemannia gamsii]|jgi:hypothetical protein|uniref:Voltage-gated hydrogen channel 1 n=1 Tax=Linnemannia gamsii TaxID=64522 RepID=A0A9P6UKZ4_9FUNG|nr:hypothetical protein BGZ97_013133 [Linnemannia gamsii]